MSDTPDQSPSASTPPTPAAPRIRQGQAIALAVVSLVLAGVAVTMLWLRDPAPTQRLELDTGTPAPASSAQGGLSPADLAARPEVQDYHARQQFEQGIHDFLDNADKLSDAERANRVRELEAEIDRREAARELSASEALLLRVSLVRAAERDKGAQMERAAALADHYRAQSEQREAAFLEAQQNDPRFQRYKQREAQIIAEVDAMPAIPGGLSRDEYLRQRLQEAREAAYAQQPPPAAPPPSP